jgi:hypothetical protein
MPVPPDVTAGHKFSKEETAFLDSPNTTRQEVLSTLGDPLLEVLNSRVLLYHWETESLIAIPRTGDVGGDTWNRADPREWGLFIAYDERGYVTAHEVRRIAASGLTEACIEWQQSKTRKQ